MHKVLAWAALVGSVVACAVVAGACWLQTSVVGWLTNLEVMAILLLITMVYERPGRHLVRAPFAWVYPVCGLLAIASAVRVGGLGWPHISSTAMGLIVFVGVLLAYVLAGLREPGDAHVTLAFPLAGQWLVAAGGVRALNPHVFVAGQAAALDLIALRPDGARAAGTFPSDVERYAAYGAQVLSPCSGVVAAAVDGAPDHAAYAPRGPVSLGNHVMIDGEGGRVVLGHLRAGSLLVQAGAAVHRGQPIGAVGNSGRSAEPHLHLHVERDERPVRIRFGHRHAGRPRPGRLLVAEPEQTATG